LRPYRRRPSTLSVVCATSARSRSTACLGVACPERIGRRSRSLAGLSSATWARTATPRHGWAIRRGRTFRQMGTRRCATRSPSLQKLLPAQCGWHTPSIWDRMLTTRRLSTLATPHVTCASCSSASGRPSVRRLSPNRPDELPSSHLPSTDGTHSHRPLLPYAVRPHDGGNTDTRVWAFNEPHASILADSVRLRGALVPYIYSLAWRAHADAAPFCRPMWWDAVGALPISEDQARDPHPLPPQLTLIRHLTRTRSHPRARSHDPSQPSPICSPSPSYPVLTSP
jgi:hypothetical protein